MADIVLRAQELSELQVLSEVMRASGAFSDVASEAQAAVRVLAGRELGLGPIESMRSFHIIGKGVEPTADLLARLVRRHPRYDYRVRELTDTGCTLEFFDSGEHAGFSTFTEADRERAGLSLHNRDGSPSNWARYPEQMFFARAMTKGAGIYAPDVVDAIRPEAPSVPTSDLLPGAGEAEAHLPSVSSSGAPAVEAVPVSVVETAPDADTASIDPAASTVETEPDTEPEPGESEPAGEDGATTHAVAPSDDLAGAAASGEVGSTDAGRVGEGAVDVEGPASSEHTDDDTIEAITAEVVQLLGGTIAKVTPYCKGQHANWQIRSYSDLTLEQWRELRAELRARAA